MTMKAKTFFDDQQIEVTLLDKPSSTGLCRVLHGDKKLVRHRNQLEPLDDAARVALGK
jgi:hypothetical protein